MRPRAMRRWCRLLGRISKTAEIERLLVYAVRDGLLWECWVYDQDQALVDAFLG